MQHLGVYIIGYLSFRCSHAYAKGVLSWRQPAVFSVRFSVGV